MIKTIKDFLTYRKNKKMQGEIYKKIIQHEVDLLLETHPQAKNFVKDIKIIMSKHKMLSAYNAYKILEKLR